MALTPKKALDAVNMVLSTHRASEMVRLDRIADALRTVPPEEWAPKSYIPEDAPESMLEIARKAEVNYLPLLVDTYGQVMKVDGYQSATSDTMSSSWADWQRNRMDARQTGLHRSVLQYGAAYALGLPGRTQAGVMAPSIQCFSPRRMTALYQDSESDEWPMLAVYQQGDFVILIDEEQQYIFATGQTAYSPSGSLFNGIPVVLQFVEPRAHDLGFVPVVRYRDRMLLAGEEQMGIVEPLLTLRDRIDELTFHGDVNLYFTAFRQRIFLGWVPQSEAEAIKAGAARIHYIDADPDSIKVLDLEPGDASAHLESRASAIRDFAAIGQVPIQALGIDGISNISDATLAGLEAGKNRRGGEIKTSVGESHEQLMRLCGHLRGDEAAAADFESEVRWADFEARSFAATVDGLVKLVGQQQGILPPEMAIEMVPGITQQQARRAQAAQRRAQARASLAALTQPPATTDAVDR